MIYRLIAPAGMFLFLSACGGSSDQPVSVGPAAAPSTQTAGPVSVVSTTERYAAGQLAGVVDTYFEENLKLNPILASFVGDHRFDDRLANSISPAHLQKQLMLEQKYLAAVRGVDKAALVGQDLLSYEMFEQDRLDAIRGMDFPAHLMPITQLFSTPSFFATLGSGAGAHPFNSVKDYDNFLSRIDGFVIWMDQAIKNMKLGMQQGVVRPRIIMEKVLPQLSAQLTDDVTQSAFYNVIKNMPATFAVTDRDRLTKAYKKAIANKIVPTYRKLHDFIENEYLAGAAEQVGLTALPDGVNWYNYMIRHRTTTDLTADEIHEIGLAEVERIKGEMEAIKSQLAFDGDLGAFFASLRTDPKLYHDTAEQLLDSYRNLKSTVDAAMPKIFAESPEAELEVRAVEAFRERSAAGASYSRPAPDGSRPGVFYVNTYDLKARPKYMAEAFYLHEAVPGHHFQIALTQQLDLPKFRRFGGYTAFTEGWGLYAESLGPELGLYTDPYQKFGSLDAEMIRSIRLVADTGMHAKGWSRDEALEFMMANSSINETRAIAEVERYIASPGQALAYKIGQLKIAGLRARAATALGSEFDLREFHTQVLKDGALPLSVLEAKIDRWISSKTK